MGGLGDIISGLVTSAATPAIGGIVGGSATDALLGAATDSTQNDLLRQLTQTTMGALSGAAVGAGLGALTGGKAGALGGALTGGMGGGVGGYNAQQINQMFGMGAPAQQSVGPSQGAQPRAPSAPTPLDYNLSANAPGIGSATAQKPPASIPSIQAPTQTPTAAAQQPSGLSAYMNFLGQNKEPLLMGLMGGTGLTTMNQYNQSAKNYQNAQTLQNLLNQQNALGFARGVYGYADGGPVDMSMSGASVHMPAHVQEEFQREGGLAALQPGLRVGLANGGYVNTQPFNANQFYPQSRINSAQPYAGAGPTSVVNTLSQGASFAHGGLLKGHGDGMSDDIPARIEGQEEVRVADGEYVIPKHVAAKFGPDKLKEMHKAVREAAHAKKGEQIQQDSAKRAFIRTMTGVHA